MECINQYFIANEKIVKTKDFPEYNGEGVKLYEVIRVIEGVPLFIEEHIKRFHSSSKKSGKELFLTDDEIRDAIKLLIKENNCYIGNVKLVFCYSEIKYFLCYFINHSYPDENMYINGVKTMTHEAIRPNPEVKAVNESLKAQINRLIEENKVYEVLLLNSDFEITEGSRSNILFIKGNKIISSPKETILKGITLEKILEICSELGFTIEERMINKKEIQEFDACFITGTSPKVLPISYIDDIEFDTKNNTLLKIKEKYDEKIKNYIFNGKKNTP